MSNEIQNTELQELGLVCDVMVKSGFFPDVKSQAQGIAKVLAGRELGLTMFQSLSDIYFVNGKRGISATIMGALILKSKKYSYTVTSITEEGCSIDFFNISEKDTPVKLGTSTFGKLNAAKAGLINKENYKAYPSDMYFCRALSSGARKYAPDAIMGFYVIEELQDVETEIIPAKTTVAIDIEKEVGNDNSTKI